ncbi:MAG: BatD family protein [Bacteroidetes bacterium]|nr:BatD family protein [Bacteroidota bacterium]
MKTFVRIVFFILFTLNSIWAQQIQVSVQPQNPVVNQPFQISYDISGLAGQYKLPSFDPFVKLGTSQQQSIVNGVSSFKISVRLLARSSGKSEIAPLQLLANGRVIAQSNPVQINVLDEASAKAKTQSNSNSAAVKKSDNQIFVVARLEKSTVYVGEPLTVSIDLYSKYSSVQFESVKFPSLSGGWVQDIPEAEDQQFRQTQVEGEPFLVATLKKYVLVPQVQGKISIDPLLASVVVSYREASSDPFDVFFGGRVVEKKVELKTPKVTLTALPIPFDNRPDNFSNGVGDFELSVRPGPTTLSVNDAFEYSVTVKGNGNLNLLELPNLNVPAEFDAFAPDVQEKISFTESGVTGSKQVNFIYIPKTPGKYTIPPFTWSWFNPATKKFESFSSDTLHLTVNGSAQDQDLSQSGPIKFQNTIPQGRSSKLPERYVSFYASLSFFVWLIFLVGLLLLYTFWGKKWLVRLRNKRSLSLTTSTHVLDELNRWKSNPSKEQTSVLINTMQAYMRDQWKLPISQQTPNDVLAFFKPLGLEQEIKDWLSLIQQLHFLAFASVAPQENANQINGLLRKTLKTLESQK